ncbi:MAG: 50S ribosomal protein L19e [Candidatus Nanoarchaeia archaeon]|nr:50S ribosomal protein L19e [Candidatus Nanoarchaeia archaeon]
MDLKTKKRLAAQVLKVSPKKIFIDPKRTEEVQESFTKEDIRRNIQEGSIVKKRENEQSRARANKIRKQKIKGLKKGQGSRKGKKTARIGKKTVWINKIRLLRKLLKSFYERGMIDSTTYRMLYMRSKGGYFRSKRHLLLFMNDQKLFKENK